MNRAILDQAWGEFARQLVYKQTWLRGEVLFVKPHYTSQSCPACGHVCGENCKTHSVSHCTQCHHQAHADYGAAVNIKRAGHARLICVDNATQRLQAQEPLEASV